MEVNMFTRPPIKNELAKYVRVRLYTDGKGVYEKQQAMQQNQFGNVALPLYAVVNTGHPLATFPGGETEFLSFLKSGSDKSIVDLANVPATDSMEIVKRP